METAELRPLSLGELLDRTFTLYRNHFWVFVGIMAIPSAVAVPMNFFAYNKQGGPLAFPNPQAQAAALTLPFWGFFAIFWLVYSLAMGAAAHAVAEAYLGRDPTVRGAYQRVGARFWPLIGLVLNVFLRVFGVFVVLVIAVAFLGGMAGTLIPGIVGGSQVAAVVVVGFVVILALAAGGGLAIYLALRYAVSIPAFLFEQLGALAAIRRSVQLTKGRRGHIFLAAFLASIISYVGVIVFQGPFLVGSLFTSRNGGWPAWLNFTAAASGAIGASITGPILMIVIVLCYYDTRIRKEAFDLQFMMQSLDRPAMVPPAAPPGPVSTA